MFANEFMIRAGFATGVVSLGLGLYLFNQCRKQQRHTGRLQQQLDELTETNNFLQERLRSSVQPHFVPLGVSLEEGISRIDIKLQNMGAPAILEKVVTSTPDIEFLDDRFFPLRIESKELFVVTGISKNLPLPECRYVVQLHFSDLHGHHYMTMLRGEGPNFKMTTEQKK